MSTTTARRTADRVTESTKELERIASDLNPADRQSHHEEEKEQREDNESAFSSDSESSLSDSDVSEYSDSDEDHEADEEKGEPISLTNTSHQSDADSEISEEEEEAEEPQRSVKFSQETKEVERIEVPAPRRSSSRSAFSSPVESPLLEEEPASPPRPIRMSEDADEARRQIEEQKKTIQALEDRIRELEALQQAKKKTWSVQPARQADVVRPVVKPAPKPEEEEDYNRPTMSDRKSKFSGAPEPVVTSFERPLDQPIAIRDTKQFWNSVPESEKAVVTSTPRPLDTNPDVSEMKNFWHTASETSKSVVTSTPKPLEVATDVESKKTFFRSASEAEKAVVTSTPRPLDCSVDVKEKRKSLQCAAEQEFVPSRPTVTDAAEVNEKKAFFTRAAEADKEIVTSTARPLDCSVDIKEKRKSLRQAAEQEFVPSRPTVTEAAEVNEKKAFFTRAAEADREIVTSTARPLDCPVDIKEKMSSYSEASQSAPVAREAIKVDVEVNEKKAFWTKAAEEEKEIVTSNARPLDVTVDVKEKMGNYNQPKPADEKSSAPVKTGTAIRMKTALESCDICTKTLYITEKIVADGKNFHKNCFKCGHCNTVLKLGNYAGLDGKFFCKPHFKQLFQSKGNYNEGFGNEKLTNKWTKA
ncbi:xin actin-binding repeat-containing protein 2 isoform 3 [Planoprotostelium fungivorum]|uniref:Xin actin-binding repeat-containing protein 2 isoform 3 n=1 Tax=Planoprotostelium fungivorum TaxID=1890364 RepID=A0A2P6NSV2_9EUKA|nr:xin actin-binding repeat-containing protein 2 isoform 3 [Planoprotostelium fungivorum]